GKDFGYAAEANQWTYWGPGGRRTGLAHPALRGKAQLRNAAAALCALDALELPITMQEIRRGLAEVVLAGRFQVLPGRPQVILDVAHNPQAAKTLEQNLAASGFAPQTIAVCGMLRDKDIAGVLREVAPRITRWHFASLSGPRAATAEELKKAFLETGATAPFELHDSPQKAFANADGVLAKLAAAKIPYYTEAVKGNLTRVRAGPFPTKDAAEKALEQLKGLGLQPGTVTSRSG